MRRASCLAALLGAAALTGGDRVYEPDVVSTSAAEVRLAISPDGRHMLWGAIGRDGGAEQQDIWERHFTGDRWSAPARASFSTTAVEFDPAFSADGRRLYFHSDRAGGFGGTDLYVVSVNPTSHTFGEPENLGPFVNGAGEEWAPTPTPEGGLIFASDGWGGFGLHDLFEADLSSLAERPRNLGPGVNGPREDFDAALVPGREELIFSSGVMDGDAPDVRLYRAVKVGGQWGEGRPLAIGCSDFLIGAAFDPAAPGLLLYAAKCPDGLGRMDIRTTLLAP